MNWFEKVKKLAVKGITGTAVKGITGIPHSGTLSLSQAVINIIATCRHSSSLFCLDPQEGLKCLPHWGQGMTVWAVQREWERSVSLPDDSIEKLVCDLPGCSLTATVTVEWWIDMEKLQMEAAVQIAKQTSALENCLDPQQTLVWAGNRWLL